MIFQLRNLLDVKGKKTWVFYLDSLDWRTKAPGSLKSIDTNRDLYANDKILFSENLDKLLKQELKLENTQIKFNERQVRHTSVPSLLQINDRMWALRDGACYADG